LLGPGEVADGKPAVGIVLGHLVPGPYIGPGRVDPQAEQAARGGSLLGGADVGVRAGAVAVLEDLDADHQRPGHARRQGGEVATDEPVAAAGGAVGELRDRGRGDVQAGEVQPGCD
jgi:hypothetical protein